MQLFYVPNISGAEVILDETESKHAVKILRMQVGDSAEIIDGRGGFYEARVTEANPKKCRLEIIGTQNDFGKKDFRIHIAIAPTKNTDRFEWFLEKATEIGIDEITPLVCERSERKVVKNDRLEKILVSAIKQSLKAYLPVLNDLTSFEKAVIGSKCKNKYIAHCIDSEKVHLKNEKINNKEVFILIGPEGDFSPEEVKLAKKYGFKEISLGNARLRTETAGVVACHIVNLIND